MQESRVADSAHWVTLTYESPPFTDNRLMTLDKTDFQKFIKRLRKHERTHSNQSIKYYACGEYGDKYERPHYHAIIFNSTPEHIKLSWENFWSPTDEQGRVLGITTFDIVNEKTIAYTAKYMNKGKLIPKFKDDDRTPEFQLFSQGLGKNFVTNATTTFFNQDPRRSSVFVNGYRKALPTYFVRKFKICPVFHLAKTLFARDMAAEKLAEQLSGWERNRTFHQTFESYRWSQKQHALKQWRERLANRNKFK